MIVTALVVLLLSGLLVVYIEDRNQEDECLWEKWDRELRETREDAYGKRECRAPLARSPGQ